MPTPLSLAVPAALALIACASSNATQPADREPGVPVGTEVSPEPVLLTSEGEEVSLGSLWSQGPVVVTFYRGGWCPYCTEALSQWRERAGELREMGVPFVAITPEKPEHTSKTEEKYEIDYKVYSDARFEAADALNLRFALASETQSKYKTYGIDLEKQNATGTWELPAPGTFLIDGKGVVRYMWADWDYTKRADPDEVIAAARALVKD